MFKRKSYQPEPPKDVPPLSPPIGGSNIMPSAWEDIIGTAEEWNNRKPDEGIKVHILLPEDFEVIIRRKKRNVIRYRNRSHSSR